jgi:hypothetical protein
MTTGNRHAFRLRPGMRRGLRTELPLPTRLVSNEEFPPLPQTAAQRAVEERILAEAARLAPRLGQSRRQFLKTSGGMAASLLAMNAVFGRFFDVLPVEAADRTAFQAVPGARGPRPAAPVADCRVVQDSGWRRLTRSTRAGRRPCSRTPRRS